MPKIEVRPYDNQAAAAWDALVDRSKNGTLLHRRGYMDYHADRFEDGSLMLVKNSRLLAVLPASRHGDQLISHGGLTYGGLLYGVEAHAVDVLNSFDEIRDFLLPLGVRRVVYKSIPRVFHRYPAEEDLYALARNEAKLYRRDLSSVIDLQCRPKLSDSRKSVARRPQRAGAEFNELLSFAEFHELLSSVLRRFHREPVHTRIELELLAQRFPEEIRLFGTVLGGRLLAAALVYDFGATVHTQYLASSDEGRELGALDGLIVHLIENVFRERRYFSFGISTESEGTVLNEGLISQKEGFGARGIVHDFYHWDL